MLARSAAELVRLRRPPGQRPGYLQACRRRAGEAAELVRGALHQFVELENVADIERYPNWVALAARILARPAAGRVLDLEGLRAEEFQPEQKVAKLSVEVVRSAPAA